MFISSMSVLVNGSPKKDFIIGRGLRHGDPMSPFLLMIFAKRLTRLIKRARELVDFHGYKVNKRSNMLHYNL